MILLCKYEETANEIIKDCGQRCMPYFVNQLFMNFAGVDNLGNLNSGNIVHPS